MGAIAWLLTGLLGVAQAPAATPSEQEPAAQPDKSRAALVELAKRERERRAAVTEPVRVISNANLAELRRAHIIMSGGGRAAAATQNEVTEEAVKEEKPAAAAPEESGPDLDFWRQAFQEAKTNLANAVNRTMVLELRMNNLRNAFLQTSDGTTRERIEAEMAQTFEALAQAREDEKAARQALADLERQAAKAGVPPGVVREMIGELPESGSSLEGVPQIREDSLAPAG
ncbi:MAG: hypothetical protein Kow00109_09870 [Acidobacteriota bacterium]